MRTKIFRLVSITLCFCWLAACGTSDKWNGTTFGGEVTINGVKPPNATVEKFKLTTAKVPEGTQKIIKLDTANQFLGNCEIPLPTVYSSNMSDGDFNSDRINVVCRAIVDGGKVDIFINYGSVKVEGDNATFSAIGSVPGNSQTYTFEIKGKRQN